MCKRVLVLKYIIRQTKTQGHLAKYMYVCHCCCYCIEIHYSKEMCWGGRSWHAHNSAIVTRVMNHG